MAHYELFRKQLAIKYPAYGHALWEPSPGFLYKRVEVGDVGYVREGKFHRLFNALLPADDESHSMFGVPEYHEPLTPSLREHINVNILEPYHYHSPRVSVAAGPEPVMFASRPDEYPRFTYRCRKKERGAVLYLPVPAESLDTIARRDFGQWMIKHIDHWVSFTRRLELGVEMEDIILVTGCHRTRSSASVVFFEDQEDAEVSFKVEVTGHDGPDTTIKWRFSATRSGGAVVNWGPDGSNLPKDQCIFIRGFRVTRPFKFLPKHLVAAGPSSDSDMDESEPDMGLTSIPTVSNTVLPCSTYVGPPTELSKYQDPLHTMLRYIVMRAPNCDIVLMHDDDLARLDEVGDSCKQESVQLDAVIHLLQKSQPEIRQVQCDLLRVDESSSKASTEATTVAMFSGEFQEWDEPPISREGYNGLRDLLSDGKASREMNKPTKHALAGDKLQEDVRIWFSPPDPRKNHNTACDSIYDGTATWFVEGDTFSEWQTSGTSSSLWIHGKPGSGKSVICSTIIQDINAMTKSGLSSHAFFYFDFREGEDKRTNFYSHRRGLQIPSDDTDECSNTESMPSPREKALALAEKIIDPMMANNHPLWLLDFIPLPIYRVVPQRIWIPPNQPAWRRHVKQANLYKPVFFLHVNGAIGLPLPQAAVGDTASLQNSDIAAPLGGRHTIIIRLTWPGYELWERQIRIRDQTRHRSEITLKGFAKLVAGVVDRFLTSATTTTKCRDPNWRIGPGGITRNNVIIIGTVQVSAGGWIPILQIPTRH